MKREEEEAWETLREKIMELEEGGIWREPRKETSMIEIRLWNPKELNQDEKLETVRKSVNVKEEEDARKTGIGVRDDKQVEKVRKCQESRGGVDGVRD